MKVLSSIKDLKFYISRRKVSHFTSDLVEVNSRSYFVVRLGLVLGGRFVTLYYSRPLSFRTKVHLVTFCRTYGLIGANF